MTPAILLARQQRVTHRIHEYTHDPASSSYGLEAADKLGIDPWRVFKTLVVAIDSGALAVGVIPVCAQLNLKQFARAAGAKKAAMADPAAAQRATGYVTGGISPLGQKKRLTTLIDTSARDLDTLYVSAGRRGLEIELAPVDLARLTGARFHPLCSD
jgi:Cys-tRNA(Pro)/Cys-tRNA(Cys) deacylase